MRRALSWLLFPLVVAAMGAYALATPSLELAAHLGLPAAADAALRPLSAILLCYAGIAGLERALPYRPEWIRSHGDVRTEPSTGSRTRTASSGGSTPRTTARGASTG